MHWAEIRLLREALERREMESERRPGVVQGEPFLEMGDDSALE